MIRECAKLGLVRIGEYFRGGSNTFFCRCDPPHRMTLRILEGASPSAFAINAVVSLEKLSTTSVTGRSSILIHSRRCQRRGLTSLSPRSLRRISGCSRSAEPKLIRIGWISGRSAKWAKAPWLLDYDVIVASPRAADDLWRRSGVKCRVLPRNSGRQQAPNTFKAF